MREPWVKREPDLPKEPLTGGGVNVLPVSNRQNGEDRQESAPRREGFSRRDDRKAPNPWQRSEAPMTDRIGLFSAATLPVANRQHAHGITAGLRFAPDD
jgi:hypothetical protein